MSAIRREKTFAASQYISYDYYEELFWCKVGEIDNGNLGAVHYTVWGETKEECQQRATELVNWLNGEIIV